MIRLTHTLTKLTCKMTVATLLLYGLITSATADTRVDTVVGTVVDTITLDIDLCPKTPTDQAVAAPRMYQYMLKKGRIRTWIDDYRGLIGSAIGNKMSDNDGAGAAGTVAGALIGREHAKNNPENSRIVGYRQQEVCSTNTVMREERINEVTGYRNHIEVDGQVIEIQTRNPLMVGHASKYSEARLIRCVKVADDHHTF